MVLTMKYVLDENTNKKNNMLPKNTINASELYEKNGLKKQGVSDEKLLELSVIHDYVIVTRDVKLVLKANRQRINIVYVYDDKEHKWMFIPGQMKIKNRIKLKSYTDGSYYNRKDTIVIPFFMTSVFNKKNECS